MPARTFAEAFQEAFAEASQEEASASASQEKLPVNVSPPARWGITHMLRPVLNDESTRGLCHPLMEPCSEWGARNPNSDFQTTKDSLRYIFSSRIEEEDEEDADDDDSDNHGCLEFGARDRVSQKACRLQTDADLKPSGNITISSQASSTTEEPEIANISENDTSSDNSSEKTPSKVHSLREGVKSFGDDDDDGEEHWGSVEAALDKLVLLTCEYHNVPVYIY